MMADVTANNSVVVPMQRLSNGQFAPGSGGRPIGAKNRISNEALRAVRNLKDEAITKLEERLRAGNWDALQFVLERVLPRGRTVELDDATPQAIKDALINGSISTEEARHLAVALEKLASIQSIEELRERLERLEALANGAK